MTELVMMIASGFALVDIAVAALLLLTYYGLFRGIRAPVSLGLMLFSVFTMAQGIVLLATYLDMLAIVPDIDAPLLAGVSALEAVGLVALLRTART
jgi:hypothetical protein